MCLEMQWNLLLFLVLFENKRDKNARSIAGREEIGQTETSMGREKVLVTPNSFGNPPLHRIQKTQFNLYSMWPVSGGKFVRAVSYIKETKAEVQTLTCQWLWAMHSWKTSLEGFFEKDHKGRFLSPLTAESGVHHGEDCRDSDRATWVKAEGCLEIKLKNLMQKPRIKQPGAAETGAVWPQWQGSEVWGTWYSHPQEA